MITVPITLSQHLTYSRLFTCQRQMITYCAIKRDWQTITSLFTNQKLRLAIFLSAWVGWLVSCMYFLRCREPICYSATGWTYSLLWNANHIEKLISITRNEFLIGISGDRSWSTRFLSAWGTRKEGRGDP